MAGYYTVTHLLLISLTVWEKCSAPASGKSIAQTQRYYLQPLNHPLTIPIDRGYDYIIQSPCCDGLGSVDRLLWVRRRWGSGSLHGAESTPPGALVAQYHDGSSGRSGFSSTPTLADVGTFSLLAHLANECPQRVTFIGFLKMLVTVFSLSFRRSFCSLVKFFPLGMSVLSHLGSLSLINA